MGRAFDADYWDYFMDSNRVNMLMVGFTKKNPPTAENTVFVALSDMVLMFHKVDYDRILSRLYENDRRLIKI